MSDDPDYLTDDDAADPSAGAADSGSRQMPEGMRVVRKRRKKRGGSRQTLFLKKREILREMHDDTGAVGVKEQVERLKSARKAKEENKPMEERWGGAGGGHRGARWILLRVFAITIPVLAIVTAFLLTRGEEGDSLGNEYDNELDLDKTEEARLPYDRTGPIAWFNGNPHEAYQDAVGILDGLNELDPNVGAKDMLRDEKAALARIAEHGLGWGGKFITADPRKLFWSTGESGETGFIVVEGRRTDHRAFRCYFVRTAEGMRLDWEASTAWSEMRFGAEGGGPSSKPMLVRCHLAKDASYDTYKGPGSLYSWYLVRSADREHHVWAYVPSGSELDRELLDLFNYGRMILERQEEVRATIRLSKPAFGFKPNEFEIVELLSKDWVLPKAAQAVE